MVPAITSKTNITTEMKHNGGIEIEERVTLEVKIGFFEERRSELTSDGKRK